LNRVQEGTDGKEDSLLTKSSINLEGGKRFPYSMLEVSMSDDKDLPSRRQCSQKSARPRRAKRKKTQRGKTHRVPLQTLPKKKGSLPYSKGPHTKAGPLIPKGRSKNRNRIDTNFLGTVRFKGGRSNENDSQHPTMSVSRKQAQQVELAQEIKNAK